ncbi:hypothetical protein [Actinomadura chibensis]|uniref:hypothetical protein n=1 Tax=Actinomadura chibensis TaxID=392828 RepID=UPI000AEEC50F|nr:hypothetical protein [Actinomadura chibensis]
MGKHDEQLRVAREAGGLYWDLAARYPKRFRQLSIDTRGDLHRRLAQRGDSDGITLDL